MKISPETLSQSVKYFKSTRYISTGLLMRKFKVSFEHATEISEIIKKRFPNLWREGKENFLKEKKV